jgi:hypothetical protein
MMGGGKWRVALLVLLSIFFLVMFIVVVGGEISGIVLDEYDNK